MKLNFYIFHATQILSIILGGVFFGWKGAILVFLIQWSINTREDAE